MDLSGIVDDPAEASTIGSVKTERRVSRRMESMRASQRNQSLLNPKLDPVVWSELPQDNLLDIFDALPVIDHYWLRRVSKQWHNRASEQREPFFLITPERRREISPMGTLTPHATKRKWMWQPCGKDWRRREHLHSADIGMLWEEFEVEGVLFQPVYMSASSDHETYHLTHTGLRNVLFDAHRDMELYAVTKAPGAYGIPHPKGGLPHPDSVLGMMVDEASRAYTLILGSCAADTLLLNSGTNEWESKPSRLVRARPPSLSTAPKSCVQLQGKMYLWMDSDEIHVYSPSSDQWSALPTPPRDTIGDDEIRGLGHWDGVLYAVIKTEQGVLSVWKLNMLDEQWSEYSKIPGNLLAYLMHPGVLPMMVSYSNGYLLLHVLAPKPELKRKRSKLLKQQSWPDEYADEARSSKMRPKLGRRFVLFNIANRLWEEVENLPYSVMWKGCSDHSRN